MDEVITLRKTYTVHLKENGEVCNRLNKGTCVHPVRQKGEWLKIIWRKGKKKGWIHFSQDK